MYTYFGPISDFVLSKTRCTTSSGGQEEQISSHWLRLCVHHGMKMPHEPTYVEVSRAARNGFHMVDFFCDRDSSTRLFHKELISFHEKNIRLFWAKAAWW